MNEQHFCLTVVVVIGSILLPGTVSAEQACPEGDTPEQIREIAADAFAEGQRLYEAGNYRAALERFQCSFEHVPHPNTLFNIGEAAELAGETALALRTFRQYMASYPDGQGREQAEARVAELEEFVEQEEETPEPPPPEPEVEEAQSVPASPTPEMRMTSARRWAWVTLALGLAIAGTGGGLYGAAVSRNAEYVQNREDFEQGLETGWDLSEFNSRADSGEGLEGAGWALMGVGLASLVTSIVLFAAFDGTENVPNDGGQSLLSLKLGDGLLGFSVSGSF